MFKHMMPGCVPNSCDCHFHVMGPPEKYPYRRNHVYPFEPAPLADYLVATSNLGIERYVLVQPSIYERDNRCLLDTLDQLPVGSARGVVAISEDESVSQLQAMHRRGVRGVRFNLLQGPNYDPALIRRTAQRISDLGWHLEVYVQGERLTALCSELSDMPARVVIDHMGQIGLGSPDQAEQISALRRLLDSGNVWVKLIGYRASIVRFPYEDIDSLGQLLVSKHSDRCLWGTDWPNANFVGRAPTPSELCLALTRWANSDRLRTAILVDNPSEVYDFKN